MQPRPTLCAAQAAVAAAAAAQTLPWVSHESCIAAVTAAAHQSLLSRPHEALTWGTAKLNDVQLGHNLPVLEGLLGKGNHVAGRITASGLRRWRTYEQDEQTSWQLVVPVVG